MKCRSSLWLIVTTGAALGAQIASAQSTAPAPPLPSGISRLPVLPVPHQRDGSSFYRLYSTAIPMAATDQYRSVLDFASCATNVSPVLSARLLAVDPRSGQAAAISRQLRGISKGCLPAGSYVSTTFFRSAVAEALYRRRGATPDLRMVARPASVPTIAECVFVQSPVSVDALLRTKPGSEAERGVLNRIAPLSRKCIVGGQPADVAGAEAFLRAGLAEVAYQSTVTPRAPTRG